MAAEIRQGKKKRRKKERRRKIEITGQKYRATIIRLNTAWQTKTE